MTIDYFNTLSLEDKARSVWNEGYVIETRTSHDLLYYQLHLMRGFYAELICNVNTDEITNIRVIFEEEAIGLYRIFKKMRKHMN